MSQVPFETPVGSILLRDQILAACANGPLTTKQVAAAIGKVSCTYCFYYKSVLVFNYDARQFEYWPKEDPQVCPYCLDTGMADAVAFLGRINYHLQWLALHHQITKTKRGRLNTWESKIRQDMAAFEELL